jgi:hypothetical protein
VTAVPASSSRVVTVTVKAPVPVNWCEAAMVPLVGVPTLRHAEGLVAERAGAAKPQGGIDRIRIEVDGVADGEPAPFGIERNATSLSKDILIRSP